jgi:hypothetical protein
MRGAFFKEETETIEELLMRIAENLVDRVSGPMKFRLIVQPTMATIFAIRAGLKDAREGRPVYFWAIFSQPEHRRELLLSGWRSVGKIFFMAIFIDLVYQVIVFRWFYPGEALYVAAILAFLPYLLVRGPTNRIARQLRQQRSQQERRTSWQKK